MEKFKTPYQLEQELKKVRICEEYDEMIQDGSSKTEVEKVLMKKHKIHSRSTIWLYRKQVQTLKTQQS